jgi:hypothetical protein
MYISESQAHKELINKLENDYLPAVKKLVNINPAL